MTRITKWMPFTRRTGSIEVKIKNNYKETIYEREINIDDRLGMSVLVQELKTKGVKMPRLK